MSSPVIPDPSKSYAVLIGSSHYETLPELLSVKNNITALRRLLIDPRVWGIPDANCLVVRDPSSPVDLVKPIASALTRAKDCFLLYFAGHGFLDEQSELCLATIQSDGENSYSGVPYELIRRELRKNLPMRTLVILDCCYSGRAASAQGAAQSLTKEAEVQGTYLIAASAPNEKALSPRGEQYTAFTGTFIDVLEHGIGDGSQVLPMTVIYEEVRHRLQKDKRPLPEAHAYNLAGSIAFRNRSDVSETNIAASSVQSEIPEEGVHQEGVKSVEPLSSSQVYRRLHWQPLTGADSPFALRLNSAARKLSAEIHAKIDSDIQSISRVKLLKIEWDSAPNALMGDWVDIRRTYRSTERWTGSRGFAEAPIDLSGGTDDISSVLEMVPSGRLAFLGEPGSGKTTVLKLASQELNDWASQSNGPVPVLLDASAWNAERESLRNWLIAALRSGYVGARGFAGVTRLAATALVDTGRIYPVLDNFDEMSAAQRTAALRRLSASALPFLLASRLNEFKDSVMTTEPPKGTAVVILKDLDAAQVRAYASHLAGRSDGTETNRWQKVAKAYWEASDTIPITRALSTPRMVSLLERVYQAKLGPEQDLPEFLDQNQYPDAESIEEALLSSSLGTPAESFAVRAAFYLKKFGATQLSWWRLGEGGRLRRHTAWCGIPAGLLAAACVFFLAIPAWPATFAGLFAAGAGLVALALAMYGGYQASARISRTSMDCWRASVGVSSFRRAMAFGAVAGALFGAVSSLPIALSSFDPPQYRACIYPPQTYSCYLLSSRDAIGAIIGSAFITALFTAMACAGTACLDEFTRPDRYAIAKQMLAAASYVAILRFLLIGSLSGIVSGFGAGAAYSNAGLGVVVGITAGLFYSFLIGLVPSLRYTAWPAQRDFLGHIGNSVRYLELLREQDLVRRAGCNYEFVDHRLVSIITSADDESR